MRFHVVDYVLHKSNQWYEIQRNFQNVVYPKRLRKKEVNTPNKKGQILINDQFKFFSNLKATQYPNWYLGGKKAIVDGEVVYYVLVLRLMEVTNSSGTQTILRLYGFGKYQLATYRQASFIEEFRKRIINNLS